MRRAHRFTLFDRIDAAIDLFLDITPTAAGLGQGDIEKASETDLPALTAHGDAQQSMSDRCSV